MTVSLPKPQTENAENKEKAKSFSNVHLQLLQNEWLSQGRFVVLYSLY